MLVPTEQVLLLAVELPLKTHSRRLAALPFAVEDRIADSLESVHLALGAPLEGDHYLVGVVRHEVMRDWIAAAEDAGYPAAAMVPDALMLPRAAAGEWNVYFVDGRALVMRDDGTGFACPAALLVPAWEAAGRPRVDAIGDRLPEAMAASYNPGRLGYERLPLARAQLDLRQGAYAARGMPSSALRRLAWVAGIGLAAHAAILLADTLMLRAIAASREAETRALVAQVAPGVPIGEDLVASVAPLLPAAGGGGAAQTFLPLANRVSAALVPVGPLDFSAIGFSDNRLALDIAAPVPGDLAARLRSALAAAGVKAEVAEMPGGAVRVTATPS